MSDNTETQQVNPVDIISGGMGDPTPLPDNFLDADADADDIGEYPAAKTNKEAYPEEPADEPAKITDEDVLKYFESKGRKVESIDEFFQEKDPYEGLPESEIEYLKFNNATKGDRAAFEFYKKDWDKADPIELFQLDIEKKTGLKLGKDEITEYLEEDLGVDISNENLSVSERIKVNARLKEIRADLKGEQSKVSESLKEAHLPDPNKDSDEIVTLDNGVQMSKKSYDAQLKKHNDFVKKNKEIVNSVADFSFKIKVDKDGKQEDLSFEFEVTDEDKQSMLSITSDVSKYVQDTYASRDGEFKQKEFNEDLFWINPKNRNRVITSLLNQARAAGIQEVMKRQGNVNFTTEPIVTTSTKEGVRYTSPKEIIDF